ncbi:MAG TPA: hypothetical protein PKA90_09330 [Ignavibacteria bacterium]|nr:hypothetical protein [Ignavibacteria bacterium]HMR40617.1 hypothetical protein [Ignavibacteria bacterium]
MKSNITSFINASELFSDLTIVNILTYNTVVFIFFITSKNHNFVFLLKTNYINLIKPKNLNGEYDLMTKVRLRRKLI